MKRDQTAWKSGTDFWLLFQELMILHGCLANYMWWHEYMQQTIRDLAWLAVSAETLTVTTGNLSEVLYVLDSCGTLFLTN